MSVFSTLRLWSSSFCSLPSSWRLFSLLTWLGGLSDTCTLLIWLLLLFFLDFRVDLLLTRWSVSVLGLLVLLSLTSLGFFLLFVYCRLQNGAPFFRSLRLRSDLLPPWHIQIQGRPSSSPVCICEMSASSPALVLAGSLQWQSGQFLINEVFLFALNRVKLNANLVEYLWFIALFVLSTAQLSV